MLTELKISHQSMIVLYLQISNLRYVLKNPMSPRTAQQVRKLSLLRETFERYVEILAGCHLTRKEYEADTIDGGKAQQVMLFQRIVKYAERQHEERYGESPVVCFINNPDHPKNADEFRQLMRNLYHHELRQFIDYLGDVMGMLDNVDEQHPFYYQNESHLSVLAQIAS